MLKIHLPADVSRVLSDACRRARSRETGGMLFGEHIGEEEFRVIEATVAGEGSVAAFVRALTTGLARLEAFFRKTNRDYRQFNYLGEWHSHPLFALRPSTVDDSSMFDIVDDASTGARFAVSLIVKLEKEELKVAGYAYFPRRQREDVLVVFG